MYIILSYLIATVIAIRYHIDMRRENPETVIGAYARTRSLNYYGKHDFFDIIMITMITVSLAPLTILILIFLVISYGIYWIIFEKLLKLKFKKPLK